ncbi:hypothetical protein D3C85_1891010 [compost metagenome]
MNIVDCDNFPVLDNGRPVTGAFDLLKAVGRHQEGGAGGFFLQHEFNEDLLHQRVQA